MHEAVWIYCVKHELMWLTTTALLSLPNYYNSAIRKTATTLNRSHPYCFTHATSLRAQTVSDFPTVILTTTRSQEKRQGYSWQKKLSTLSRDQTYWQTTVLIAGCSFLHAYVSHIWWCCILMFTYIFFPSGLSLSEDGLLIPKHAVQWTPRDNNCIC
jgi:hypothetical protein